MAKAIATKEHFDAIELDFLRPSPTNPRTSFNEEALEELVESIKVHGIIEPFIVRPDKKEKGMYEIVCGHRRFNASIKAGLIDVPCIIRNLTDEQVTDQQIHENLKREDLNPIDEAKTYALMREKGATLAEIVARAGRGDTYIQKRLQLTNLIEKVAEDVKEGYLPLAQAVEISKYPADAQEAIYEKLYGTKWVHPETGEDMVDEDDDNYEDENFDEDDNYDEDGNYLGPDEDDVEGIEHAMDEEETDKVQPVEVYDKTQLRMSANNIARFIEQEFMLDLATAPFSLEATNLRGDGLACVVCPERTGANTGLFETGNSEQDFCLNRNCFIGKRVQFINITRKQIAKDLKVEPNDVPLIYANYNDRRLMPERVINTLFEGFRTDRSEDIDLEAEDEDDRDKPCEFMVMAMNTRGESGQVCFEDSGCKEHHWANRYERNSNGSPASKLSDEEVAEQALKIKRDRREEIFDCKVAEVVRVEVVKQAAENFAKTGLGILSDYTDVMTARLWQCLSYNEKNSFEKFCTASVLTLPEVRDSWDKPLGYEVAIKGLTAEDRAKLLIILSHYWKGDVRMNQFKSQKGVRQVAEYFGVNYKLIDAQTRLEFSSKKEKKKFEAYLQQVEVNDPQASLPRVYSEGYLNCDEKPERVAVAEIEDESEPEDAEPYNYECPSCGKVWSSHEVIEDDVAECPDCHDLPKDEIAEIEDESVADFFEVNGFQAISVACPSCKAKSGTRCIRPSGHTTAQLHADRKKLADEEFIRFYGEDAVIDFDQAENRWGVRNEPNGDFVAHSTKVGRQMEQEVVESEQDEMAEIADELDAMFDEQGAVEVQ